MDTDKSGKVTYESWMFVSGIWRMISSNSIEVNDGKLILIGPRWMISSAKVDWGFIKTHC